MADAVFLVDHIRARKHGGRTTSNNLAYRCASCNLHEGTDPAGFDDARQRVTPLFRPRADRWDVHFRWVGLRLVGRGAK